MTWNSRWLLAAPLALFVLFTAASWAIAPPVTHAPANGSIVHPAGVTTHDADAKYYDVGCLPNGSVRVAFEDTSVACPPDVTDDCALTGVRVLDNATGAVEWRYEWHSYQQFSTEVHDAEYLPDRGEMLIADMERERVFAVDMATKRVTWQWNASQVYQEPGGGARSTDWLHINDVDRIKPGRYLVSVRNADQLLILDRSCTCAVETINRNSDATVLNKQHNPQWLGDGTVLVSDSENDRVVQLERGAGGRWRVTWTLYDVGGQRLDWPRDADRLPNGNLLITDTNNHRIVVAEPDGEVVRSLHLDSGEHVYEADWRGLEYPAGPSLTGTVAPVRGQPLGVVSYAYNGLHYWIGLPYWMNEWHVFWGALAVVATVGIGVSRWWRS